MHDRNELVPIVESDSLDAVASAELGELEAQARSFARDSRAASTWRAYDSDFADFRSWCGQRQPVLDPLPALPATVALYITALAERRKPSTIRRRIASISVARRAERARCPRGARSSRGRPRGALQGTSRRLP